MEKAEAIDYLKTHQNFYLEKYGVRFVGIFGSVARDEAKDDSDIDILYSIEEDRKLSLFNYLKLLSELEKAFGKKVDLVRDETVKSRLKRYIQRDLVHV
ncbi:nucleotidyltransferase family protein [Nitratifractor sp.]